MDEGSPLLAGGGSYINSKVCKQHVSNKIGNDASVNCQICNAVISICNREEHLVVKCSSCNETTPIKGPPPGKQFVRCTCNCLLICKTSTTRVVCPRPTCRHMTILSDTTVELPTQSTRESIKTDGGTFTSSRLHLTCGSCHRPFSILPPFSFYLYTEHRSVGDRIIYFLSRGSAANWSLLISSRCPHCQTLTSVGPGFARVRWTAYLALALIFLILSISVIAGTVYAASQNHVLYFLWSILCVIPLICLIRFIIVFRMPVSAIEISASNAFPPTSV